MVDQGAQEWGSCFGLHNCWCWTCEADQTYAVKVSVLTTSLHSRTLFLGICPQATNKIHAPAALSWAQNARTWHNVGWEGWWACWPSTEWKVLVGQHPPNFFRAARRTWHINSDTRISEWYREIHTNLSVYHAWLHFHAYLSRFRFPWVSRANEQIQH